MYCFRLIKLTLIRSENEFCIPKKFWWASPFIREYLPWSVTNGHLQIKSPSTLKPEQTPLQSWQFLVPSLSIRKVPNVSWLFFGAFDIRITPTCSHSHGFLITLSVIIYKLLLTRAFFPCVFGALSYVQHQLGPSPQRLLQGTQKYTGEHQKYITLSRFA